MRRNFPEISQAWTWLEENQDKFEKPVFGPPMISCSVKDDRYSDQIQSLLQPDDFTCFTAQTKSDYKKLSDCLIRDLSLSVPIRSCSQTLDAFQRPANDDQLRGLGLDGFAIDMMDGPEPVLAMLCAEKRLHMAGLSIRDHTDEQYDRLVQSSITQWVAGRHSYQVRRRREYGPNAMTAVTKNVQPGTVWTSQPIDVSEKQQLQRQLAQAKGEWEELKEQNAKNQKEHKDVITKQEESKDRIVSGCVMC